ncbi:helix-turn-helix domain-containing protein [Puerhibacterium puerhi]|uniref:helix-turn-helix domain-containing protein n=1 Tax=Puerhibacterium puerhi TaxID=2692623 RepID=UPI00135CBB20|nr:helix-turn-helix transcriptional regulator [Puerhibacterium puerhi]
MARTPKQLGPHDEQVAEILRERFAEAGITQVELEARSGISRKRLGKIFNAEAPPATVGEIYQMSEVLDLRVSDVVRWAEERVAASSAAPPEAPLVTLDGEVVDPEDYTLAAMDRDADDEVEARQVEP